MTAVCTFVGFSVLFDAFRVAWIRPVDEGSTKDLQNLAVMLRV